MRKYLTLLFLLTLISCANQTKPIQEPEQDYDSIANEGMKQIEASDEVIIDETKSDDAANSELLVGSYRCQRTNDVYAFYSDRTGTFFTGEIESDFTWKRSGNNVTINYEIYGEQKLTFDPQTKTIIEMSESFGELVFQSEKK